MMVGLGGVNLERAILLTFKQTLMYAIRYNGEDVKTIQLLLQQKKINVNTKDKDGWCPVLLACAYAHTDILKALIAKGANPNSCTDRGWDGKRLAQFFNQTDNYSFLLELEKSKATMANVTMKGSCIGCNISLHFSSTGVFTDVRCPRCSTITRFTAQPIKKQNFNTKCNK